MNTNLEVEIIRACAYGDVGARLLPNATLRDWLVANGFARVVEIEDRPAKLGRRAAEKIAAATRKLV
jgi:hypothetical protein